MDLMEEVRGFSKEEVFQFDKAEAESKVVSKGSYEGIVYTWNEIEDDKKRDDDAYKGKRVYRVGVRCFDYPEFGKNQIAWVKVSGEKVFGDSGTKLKAPSATGKDMTKVTSMYDADITEILDQMKVIRATYFIDVWDRDDKENPGQKLPGGNWCRGVKAL